MYAAPQPISPILCEDRIRSRIGERSDRGRYSRASPEYAAARTGLCLSLRTFSPRESKGYSFLRATPFLGHPLPKQLSREAPALGQDDRCNHDPRRGGICEGNSQEGHP
jgi:hypothetical protein